MSEAKRPATKRHRQKITLTLADETFAAIEQRLKENPGLRTRSAAVDDLILRPSPPKPH